MSYPCHLQGIKRHQASQRVAKMNDHMFVETLIISSSFFAIAVILIASVLFLEKRG
ncbi:hypothetical protein ECL_02482 [Enterobacter cloacae subsp. cloacae ATCC 13047]|uniref:Uncharacterized protein YoaI n=2 Tax=Enterobacter cloacae TaxID=550 RepID=A0A0H3CK92_ENTCC|nr:hypothetical protein ECL_02482 [Enterobacter cloacae subsp. cloacae ATCC 13047]